MILYGCLFYILIKILSTFDLRTSITSTLYFYSREQETPPPEMQTHANESMTTQFMHKKTHAKILASPPAGSKEGRKCSDQIKSKFIIKIRI